LIFVENFQIQKGDEKDGFSRRRGSECQWADAASLPARLKVDPYVTPSG
jgi:hypothetical protein